MHQNTTPNPKPKHPSRKTAIRLVIIITIIAIALWIAATNGLLPTLWNINSNGWANIIIGVGSLLGVLFAFIAILPQETKYTPEPAIPSPPIPQPQLPPSTPTLNNSYKSDIRSLPPPTDASSTQQRTSLVEEVYAELTATNHSGVVLQGMGGIGKSTLAALIFKHAEQQRTTGKGPFTAEALWLKIDLATTFSELASSIHDALGTPRPDLPSLLPAQQVYALMRSLATTNAPRLIVLDQFENFLDWNSGHARSESIGVDEFIDAINSQPTACRLLLTSRPKPVGVRGDLLATLHLHPIVGLSNEEGIALLHSQKVHGSDSELQQAVARCQGHGLALRLLITLLNKFHERLATFLTDTPHSHLWDKDIAEKLLDKIYQQHLDPQAQQLLQAFSIYREAVPLAAVQAILDTQATNAPEEMLITLSDLLEQNLFHVASDGHYELHPIVSNYAQHHFVTNDPVANQQALQNAHAKAAHYYTQLAAKGLPKPSQRRGLKDVQPLIEAIWQHAQAQQWQEAYRILNEEDLSYNLSLWGANALLTELCQLLLSAQPNYQSKQVAHLYERLASAQNNLGQKRAARQNLEVVLQIQQNADDRRGEGSILNNLGLVSKQLGEPRKALQHYEQALVIMHEVGDRRGEGATLNNLGSVYDDLGDKYKALQYYQRALDIRHEVGDRSGEGITLNNLGAVYNALGEAQQALHYHQQALAISREVGDRGGEGTAFNNLGLVYIAMGEAQQALQCYQQALAISREVDRRGEGITLNNLGVVYDTLGKSHQALQCYQQALDITREVGNRGGEGDCLWSIGANYFHGSRYDVALACFLLTKRIYQEVESPNAVIVEELLTYLHRMVGERQFATLLAQVESQASEIVAAALQEIRDNKAH